jgi:hypothetical protein
LRNGFRFDDPLEPKAGTACPACAGGDRPCPTRPGHDRGLRIYFGYFSLDHPDIAIISRIGRAMLAFEFCARNAWFRPRHKVRYAAILAK